MFSSLLLLFVVLCLLLDAQLALRLNYKSLPKPLKQATQKRVLNFIDCVNRLCEIEATTSSISLPEAKKKLLVERSQKLETIILQTNMRLVYSIALQHQGMGVNIDDLVDEGVLGLRHALSKYDITRGYAFSTYAYPWIKDYMRSALSKALPISLPRHVYKLLVKVRGLQASFFAEYGRAPLDEELMAIMGLTSERFDVVRRAFALAARCDDVEDTRKAHFDESTWEQVVESNFEGYIIDHIKSTEQASPSSGDLSAQSDVMSAVLNVIQTLPNAEAVVVYNRLGLTSMNGQFQYSGNAKSGSGKGGKKRSALIGAMPSSAKVASELYSRGMRKLRKRMSMIMDEKVMQEMARNMIVVN